ncbi:hypothetical protein AVEN_204074-1 [Araneus ventricosus]|uniref:Uncharacterized protein n=1 Tax=Araneus ventricosus TaxID=182803 RepID=A0A4Y2AI59_ARAVE|nr:hypothetical protein AVEN_204074-1 [Araneus ventricosus]
MPIQERIFNVITELYMYGAERAHPSDQSLGPTSRFADPFSILGGCRGIQSTRHPSRRERGSCSAGQATASVPASRLTRWKVKKTCCTRIE